MSSGQAALYDDIVESKEITLNDTQQECYDIICKYDTIVRMKTGSGKTYPILQFAQNHGTTIIVEPLTAICNDIAARAKEFGITVHAIHGAMTKAESFDYEHDKALNKVRLIITTPETLIKNEYLLQNCKMVNIDEAHCMSMYGDMRADYWRLAKVLIQYPDIRLVLTSATITKAQMDDIRHLFSNTRDFALYYESPWRDNLTITAQYGRCTEEKLPKGKGIIFCQTINEVIELQKVLGPKCVTYYGKMTVQQKRRSVDMYVKGLVSIMIATSALGMGVSMYADYVVHTNPAMSFEAQLQECGRAGRYSAGTCQIWHSAMSWQFINHGMIISNPDEPTIHMIFDRIGVMFSGKQGELVPNLDYRSVGCAIHILERLGYIDCTETEDETLYIRNKEYDKVDISNFTFHRKQRYLNSIINMRQWIKNGCIREIVENYFRLEPGNE